ncbi:hypothetical protein QQF64_002630, partial [Cirrhinus molitorella]
CNMWASQPPPRGRSPSEVLRSE